MSSIFSSVETLVTPRSRFHFKKTQRTTYNYGKLYPAFARVVQPSETVRIGMQTMIKVQPMVAPSMTPQRMDTYFFYVPFRLLDDDFEEGYTGVHNSDGVGYSKGEAFNYQFPLWSPTSDDLKVGSLWDYFGLPINVKDYLSITPYDPSDTHTDYSDVFYDNTNVKGIEPTAYLRRAYNLIYNTMFRDENLCDEVDLDDIDLKYRAYRPDYFTKSLPFPYKPTDIDFALPFSLSGFGNIPFRTDYYDLYSGDGGYETFFDPFVLRLHQHDLGSDSLFYNDGSTLESSYLSHNLMLLRDSDNNLDGVYTRFNTKRASDNTFSHQMDVGIGKYQNNADNGEAVYKGRTVTFLRGSNVADYLNVSSSSISEIRNAFQLLKESERTSRTGSRYDEYIKGHFSEFIGDARVQLPEFVGGFKTPILVGDSIQSSATASGTTAQGNRVGVGNAVGGDRTRFFHCPEAGLIIGISSILPQSEYMQGMDRSYVIHDRLDFVHPEFCCLSEREVYTGELVVSNSSNDTTAEAHNLSIFGFQGIYNEHRTGTNQTTGQMRTLYQYWHQTRIFDPSESSEDSKPVTRLNSDFVEASEVSFRCFANTNRKYDPFMVLNVFDVDTIMPITKRAIPGLIDHF
ncbi:major capsid protein [Alces alces faeces associated microvirus MP15 5067]|uniref:major capsid protein n=1 Tax=Alces alces faeces associated microvirus MP15 5067 TaxID=2219136 RepID=UPI000DF0A11E|nr:major capsid protein [Alces alces faeces associated microvirus MP15 5067]AXB22580.1 major capsid protein [Alces alces faeces associated microvirus MP15 5067]